MKKNINGKINELIPILGERLKLNCPVYSDKINNIVNLKSTEQIPLSTLFPDKIVELCEKNEL